MTVTATLSRSTFTGLRCKECGHPYEASARHVCEDVCFGPLEVVYDYEAIKNKVVAWLSPLSSCSARASNPNSDPCRQKSALGERVSPPSG